MQEELDDAHMHTGAFGKGKGFAHESPETLAQGIVKALNVMSRAPFGVAGLMLAGRQDIVVALQMIRIQ